MSRPLQLSSSRTQGVGTIKPCPTVRPKKNRATHAARFSLRASGFRLQTC